MRKGVDLILDSLLEGKELEDRLRKRVSLTKLLRERYGTKTRKGMNKLEYGHVADVVDYTYIEKLDDVGRSLRLYKGALLHDALEDGIVTEKEMKELLGADNKLIELVKLLSRNHKNRNSVGYIAGILGNEDAIIVKLADRIANMKDLNNWIENEEGFTESSLRLADKYVEENRELVSKIRNIYPNALKTLVNNPIPDQLIVLDREIKKLDRNMSKYDVIKEGTINEKVFAKDADLKDLTNFNITQKDISKTYNIIKDLYNKSEELRDAYPNYLTRLSKVMKKLERKIDDKGYEYVKRLFDKVKFDKDDFVKEYQDYVDKKLMNNLKKLQSMKERVPKDGLVERISKDSGKSVMDIYDIAEGEDKEGLGWLYNEITRIMNEEFDGILKELRVFAERGLGGEFIYRPTKFKNRDRAIVKYFENKADKDGQYDFLELTDLLGFRGRFDNIDDVIEFAIMIIEDTDYNVFKLNNYVGKGIAYQGININLNYEGLFNFEVQSVTDTVQVATDINHDVLYKELMKVSSEEKMAIAMLVQISLGLMFDDLFKGIK